MSSYGCSLKRLAVVASLMILPADIALAQTPNVDPRRNCPITPAPQTPFVPAGAQAQPKNSGSFFFGTPKLSVLLTHSWIVNQRSVRWFSEDAHATPFNMTITGRRLDPDVAYVASSLANSQDYVPKFTQGPSRTQGNLILSGIDFRTPGCWEITARLNDTVLRFVTYIT